MEMAEYQSLYFKTWKIWARAWKNTWAQGFAFPRKYK